MLWPAFSQNLKISTRCLRGGAEILRFEILGGGCPPGRSGPAGSCGPVPCGVLRNRHFARLRVWRGNCFRWGLRSAAAGLVLGLVVLAGGSGSSSAVSAATADAILTAVDQSMCSSSAPAASGSWSAAEMSNAATIVSVSDTLSGENRRAAQIALMTAITESGLNDDPGGMGGAIGLFQQTPPAWGTASQILDPAYAAGAFVKRLLGGGAAGRSCRRGRRRRRCRRRGRASRTRR